jgi:hypothetical protein
MDKKFKVSKKLGDGKWFTFGTVKPNQYGNLTLGLVVTEELRKLMAESANGGWLNFSLFEDDGEKKDVKSAAAGDTNDGTIAF